MLHKDCEPGHSPPATKILLWKTNQPKSSYPEEKSSALKVAETSLVQFRVNAYDLACIKGLLAQHSPQFRLNSDMYWGQNLGWISRSAPLLHQQ